MVGKSEWWCHGPGVAGEETVVGVSGWPWQRVGGRSVLWWVGRPGPAVARTSPCLLHGQSPPRPSAATNTSPADDNDQFIENLLCAYPELHKLH